MEVDRPCEEEEEEEEIEETDLLFLDVVKGNRSKLNLDFISQYKNISLPLLEVFSVHINSLNTDGDYLYGSIKATNGDPDQYLYNIERPSQPGYSESKAITYHEGDNLLLTGPSEFNLIAIDPLYINVTLMNCESKPCIAWITWVPANYNLFDVPLSATLSGDFGSVTFNYAVFRKPMAAKVEVVLLPDDDHHNNNNNGSGDGEETPPPPPPLPKRVKTTPPAANVFGRITAKNSFYEDGSMLFFSKPTSSGIHVNHGEPIPLSRSIVALPFTSTLKVEVDLSLESGGGSGSGSGSLSVKGEAEFEPPHRSTPSERYISGKKIQVKVTWKECFSNDPFI